jgi:hypothetical protein
MRVLLVVAVLVVSVQQRSMGQSGQRTPVEGAPGVFTVRLVDTPEVRAIRAEAGPGVTRPLHQHPVTLVMIPLTEGIQILLQDKVVATRIREAQLVPKCALHGFNNPSRNVGMVMEMFMGPSSGVQGLAAPC